MRSGAWKMLASRPPARQCDAGDGNVDERAVASSPGHRFRRRFPAGVSAARQHLPAVLRRLGVDHAVQLLVHRNDEVLPPAPVCCELRQRVRVGLQALELDVGDAVDHFDGGRPLALRQREAACEHAAAGAGRRVPWRVFVRHGLPPGDDGQAMGQRRCGDGFSVDASVRIADNDRAGRAAAPPLRPDSVRSGPAARARSRTPALRERQTGTGRNRPADPDAAIVARSPRRTRADPLPATRGERARAAREAVSRRPA